MSNISVKELAGLLGKELIDIDLKTVLDESGLTEIVFTFYDKEREEDSRDLVLHVYVSGEDGAITMEVD